MSTTSTAVQNLVKIRPWGASRQIGEKQLKMFFFIYTLFKKQVRPLARFTRLMAQMTRTHARMCLFWLWL